VILERKGRIAKSAIKRDGINMETIMPNANLKPVARSLGEMQKVKRLR